MSNRQRVLITGAAGLIGGILRRGLRGSHLLRLCDVAPLGEAHPAEELLRVDIRDIKALERCLDGVDSIVHLAGVSTEEPWESILPMNIEGCYNVFEAARRQGVKRVIFASSNHAIGFHRRERHLDARVDTRPDTRYGVSKVFGEALGRFYADKFGVSVACLRIGTCREPDRPGDARHLHTWISHRDTVQLVRRCLDHPHYHFLIAYGVSNNTRGLWDNSAAQFLGYLPVDNAEAYAEEIQGSARAPDPISALFHGGDFCSQEFAGRLPEID